MIARYSRPEMSNLWSDESRFQLWLEIETLALEGMVKVGKPLLVQGKFMMGSPVLLNPSGAGPLADGVIQASSSFSIIKFCKAARN